MRKSLDRQTVLLCVLLVALAASAGWAWSSLAASRRSATLAAEDARAAAGLSRRLAVAGGRRPTLASAERPNLELATRIDRARASVDLPPDAIAQIGQEQKIRLNDDTSEWTRQISLRGVPLPKVAAFARALLAAAGDLRVKSLRLGVPAGGGDGDGEDRGGDRWNAEVTLAYTVYDPAGDANR